MNPAKLTEQPSPFEWRLIGAMVGLATMGSVFIYSASLGNLILTLTQVAWYLLGFAAAAAVCLVDYSILARWAMVAYWLSIVPLIAVLLPGIGVTHGWGARRWIDLGPVQFQPSEFAKLAFIFAQAHFLSRPLEELRHLRVFVKAVGLGVLPFVLILREPDLGSALVLLPVGLVMMYVAGTPPRLLGRLIGLGALLGGLVLVDVLFAPADWPIQLEPYQRKRLLVYLGQDFAPPNATEAERQRARSERLYHSHNVKQALISVGSGGLLGKGWRQGTQNVLGYLPRRVAHNDFIFPVIAEEMGFVGSVGVLGLYTVVLFTGLKIAGQARDRLGKLLAVGVVTLLFSHVFINIGMNLRIMPVTGIPLPLLSYGGSSVLCSLIAAGILHNVYLHRRV